MAKPHTADLTLHFDPQGALLQSTLDCEAEVFAVWLRLGRWRSPAILRALRRVVDVRLSRAARRARRGHVRVHLSSTAGLWTVHELGGQWDVDGPGHAGRDRPRPQPDLGRRERGGPPGARRDGVMHAAALYHGCSGFRRQRRARLVSMIDERVRRLLGMFGLLVPPDPGHHHLGVRRVEGDHAGVGGHGQVRW